MSVPIGFGVAPSAGEPLQAWVEPDQGASVPQVVFSPAQAEALLALVDGSGVDVSLTRSFDGLAQGFILDAGVGEILPVLRITINAATDVIAAERIASGGTNTFETTIDGNSLTGEVIPISVGAGTILSVFVGSSATASALVDGDGTVTVDEIGKWEALEADDCNVVYVRFAPPRSSGRYCDVSIVGKVRG